MAFAKSYKLKKLTTYYTILLERIKKKMINSGEFTDRVLRRHKIFWGDPAAEKIRNVRMSHEDPIEKWMDVPYWQRKLSNKANAREFALMQGCQVPDLYWRGSDVENIDFSALPPYYVIRPTTGHSAKMVYVMDHGTNLFDGKQYEPEEIVAALKAAVDMKEDQEFLIEEFLQNEEGEYKVLTDYKIFCFNGEIATIWEIKRIDPKKGFATFYDENWNRIDEVHIFYPPKDAGPPPKCFPEMVSQAKSLSKAYGMFVRLDFYATNRGAVFGEFTPTPALGKGHTPFGKKLMIKYWDKYCKGQI
jgi:hypothetical protein